MVKNRILGSTENQANDDFVFVPFNSWQFVQFDMSDQLCTSMIVAITKELEKGIKNHESAVKTISSIFNGIELLKASGRLGAIVANEFVKQKTEVDVKSVLDDAGLTDAEKLLRKKMKTVTAIDTITSLQENLQKTINARLGITDSNDNIRKDLTAEQLRKKRIIIFVDDLDRLSPEKAIEVMETLKMFFDCEHCVFLLAIDYDVVVNGVAIKYKNTIAADKGRDFFEKMIQVVYTLPDALNHTDRYIAEILKDNGQNISLAYDFADLVKKGNKDNPRSIKRLMNSYLLLTVMREHSARPVNDQFSSAVMFALLCLQSTCPELYDEISEQFSGRYNCEKGIQWFNTLHQYCHEMSTVSGSGVNINKDKLAKWNLLRQAKYSKDAAGALELNRDKLSFLSTFCEKVHRDPASGDLGPGHLFTILDVLELKDAVKWTDLVLGRDSGYTKLDNVAMIDIICGDDYSTRYETRKGTIQEAYEYTVEQILSVVQNYEDRISCGTVGEDGLSFRVENLIPKGQFQRTVEVFPYFLSFQNRNADGWKEIDISGTQVWMKVDFQEVDAEIRFDMLIRLVWLLSDYTKVNFRWFRDRRGKTQLATRKKQRQEVMIEQICFIQVDGQGTYSVPERDPEKAYFDTVKLILKGLNQTTFERMLSEHPAIIRDISQPEEDDSIIEWELNDEALDDEVCDDEAKNDEAECLKRYGDSLDAVFPNEYEDEETKRERKNYATKDKFGWYSDEFRCNNWRHTALWIEGQKDFDIYVGEEGDYAKMAKNACILSRSTGINFKWYSDPYMENMILQGSSPQDKLLEQIRDGAMRETFQKAPELFQTPTVILTDNKNMFEEAIIIPCSGDI